MLLGLLCGNCGCGSVIICEIMFVSPTNMY